MALTSTSVLGAVLIGQSVSWKKAILRVQSWSPPLHPRSNVRPSTADHRPKSPIPLAVNNGLGSEVVLNEPIQRPDKHIFDQVSRNQVQRLPPQLLFVDVFVGLWIKRPLERVLVVEEVGLGLQIRWHVIVGRVELQRARLCGCRVTLGAEKSQIEG